MLIFWISLCFFKIFSVQLSLVGLLVLLGQCDRLERVRGLPQRETKEFSAKDFFFFLALLFCFRGMILLVLTNCFQRIRVIFIVFWEGLVSV